MPLNVDDTRDLLHGDTHHEHKLCLLHYMYGVQIEIVKCISKKQLCSFISFYSTSYIDGCALAKPVKGNNSEVVC